MVITTGPGVTITGQVTFESGAAAQPMRVSANSPDPGGPPTRIYDNNQGAIDEKGRFQIRGLSGRAIFNVFPVAPGGGPGPYLKSIMLNGEDITDMPLDITTVTERGSTL